MCPWKLVSGFGDGRYTKRNGAKKNCPHVVTDSVICAGFLDGPTGDSGEQNQNGFLLNKTVAHYNTTDITADFVDQ